MQVDCYKENSLTFKIINTEDVDDIKTFYEIWKKIKAEALKKGFRSMFTAEEKGFIKAFTTVVMENE
jgi:hypothetical protein